MIARYELSRIGRLTETDKLAEITNFFTAHATVIATYFGDFQPEAGDQIESYCEKYWSYPPVDYGSISPEDFYKVLDSIQQMLYELPDREANIHGKKIRFIKDFHLDNISDF